MLRALWVDVRARPDRAGRQHAHAAAGAQLLPQSSRQTLSRKLREAVMAMALDAHFTKADLMNAYINEIFLGQDGDRAIHGFGLASQFYFGKPLAELDLSEVALLVAVVRGPSYYDPRRHPERALQRRNLVLKIIAEQGVVRARGRRRGRAPPARGREPPGRCLLPGVSRLRAPHAAARLSRRGSDRGGAAHLHQSRAARAGAGRERARARARSSRPARIRTRRHRSRARWW